MLKKIPKIEFLLFLILFSGIAFIFRDVFLHNKIVFNSNLLVSFFSPWKTHPDDRFPNGLPFKPIGGNDNVRMFYPYRTFINESFSQGEFPLWNPYNFSGSPILANFQSAAFYPLNVFYFFLPQETAWSLLTIIQPLLGTLFMYLFLRLFIKEKEAASLGAVAFGFSGFILVWSMENAVVASTSLWFPLILYAAEKFIASVRPKYFILLVLALSSCIFAGFLQTAFYIFAVANIFGLFQILQRHKNKLRLSLFFQGAFLLSLLVCAIQLIPSIEAFFQSARSSSSIEQVLRIYLLPIRYYFRLLASDLYGNPATYNYFGRGFYHESIFYIGIIPLIFIVLAFLKARKNSLVRFFTWTAVLTFVLAIKSPATDWLYRQPILLVNTFTPSRILFITSSALSIISAFGFSYWLKNNSKANRRILARTVIFFTAILIFFCAFYYLIAISQNKNGLVNFFASFLSPSIFLEKRHALTCLRNILLPIVSVSAVIPLTALYKRTASSAFLIVLVAFLGQLYFLNKYAVINEKTYLYPDHFIFSDIKEHQNISDRFLSFGLPIMGNLTMDKHIYSPDGIDPVFPRRYGQLVYAAKNGGLYEKNIPRIEVAMSGYSDNYKDFTTPHYYKLMSLLGVNRVYNYEKEYKEPFVLKSLFPQKIFAPLFLKEDWQAYEYKNSYPRAFLADQIVVESDPQKILYHLFDPSKDLRKTVILEEQPENFPAVKVSADVLPPDSVSFQMYKPQKIQLEVNSAKNQILFLSDNYYPGWIAKVDNTKTKIYRADFAFRAIVVPQGKHLVEFSFEPLSFRIGAVISVSAIIFLFSFLSLRSLKTVSNSKSKSGSSKSK